MFRFNKQVQVSKGEPEYSDDYHDIMKYLSVVKNYAEQHEPGKYFQKEQVISQYTGEPYKSRRYFTCPKCGAEIKFPKYFSYEVHHGITWAEFLKDYLSVCLECNLHIMSYSDRWTDYILIWDEPEDLQ